MFSKNRDRLLNQEVAQLFFQRVKAEAQGLMSDEHFVVDGTLIEAWASHTRAFSGRAGMKAGPMQAAPFTTKSGLTRLTNQRPIRRRGCIEVLRSGSEAELFGTYGGGEPRNGLDRGGRHGGSQANGKGGTRGWQADGGRHPEETRERPHYFGSR